MPYSDTLFLNLMARVEHGFGKLEEGQRQNRMASEERTKAIHKRIDKLEEKIERQVPSPSSTGWYGTLETTFKVLGAVYTYWPRIVWVLSAVAAFWGLKNPEFLKVFTLAKP